jgi:hypothetical protein
MGRGTRAREVRAPAAREYRRRSPQSSRLPAGVVDHAGTVGRVEEQRRRTTGGTGEMLPLRSTPAEGGRGFGAVVLTGALARGWH